MTAVIIDYFRAEQPQPGAPHGTWRQLAMLLVLAGALRVAVALLLPNIQHPDEIFQTLEQAHRLIFDSGVVPWEFRTGARSWLLPGILAPLMSLGAGVPGLENGHVLVPQLALIALSLVTVAVAYWWGARSGTTHAWLAACAAAVWFELLHFAPKALTEAIATPLLLTGIYLALPADRAHRRRLLFAGACLGLAFVLRFHLAPAIAIAVIYCAGAEFRQRWSWMLIGGSVPLAIYAAIDWSTWGAPFFSIYENFRANIVQARSHRYGTMPPYTYVAHFVGNWGGASIPLVALVLLGARRTPVLLLVAATIIASHMLIAHKEYRFLFPAIACLVVLAGIGTAELLALLRPNRHRAAASRLPVVLASIAWVATSGILAVQDSYRYRWTHRATYIEAWGEARHWQATCGIGLLGVRWSHTAGYTYLHRDLPLYLLDDYFAPGARPESFNVVLTKREQAPPATWGFRPWRCFSNSGEAICLHRRAGACTIPDNPEVRLDAALLRVNQ